MVPTGKLVRLKLNSDDVIHGFWVPAITGKIELEYEGELVGGHAIAHELIRRAADATMHERAGSLNTDDMVMWFDQGNALQVDGDVSSGAMVEGSRSCSARSAVRRSGSGRARSRTTAVSRSSNSASPCAANAPASSCRMWTN